MSNRDLTGYGTNPPDICWPNGGKIAISFVLNYEEGAELSPIHGDEFAESYGGEFPLSIKPKGTRHLSIESLFEYGSRVGVWRLLRLFDNEDIPLTIFATGLALHLNPKLGEYLQQSLHEVAGHGWRWVDYSLLSRKEEKKHIERCIQTIEQQTGQRICGWYTGRRSENTRSLLQEIGDFLYDSDSYADDLPYIQEQQLIIPYTLINNDFRYTTSPGFSSPIDFLNQLKCTVDYLHQENRLALMTIGMHARISGHPGRCMVLQEFIEYLRNFPKIWITRRVDIARFWLDKCIDLPVNHDLPPRPRKKFE